VFTLAIPMVLSNITVPLLGLVDAAVIGHLQHAWYLGGVAVGGAMINLLFWLLGFLRMATTGLSAQALGQSNIHRQGQILLQGLFLALILSLIILLLHSPIQHWIFYFSDATAQVKYYGQVYFSTRIWGAPAALMNLVIIGWLLGSHRSKGAMWILIITNLVNILLDLWFVLGLGWQVEGAALASAIADYCGLITGLFFVVQLWRSENLPSISSQIVGFFNQFALLIRLNRDIFLRSLCLQVTFFFMTFQGASLGTNIVAANAVLMSFLMLISYAMDGFAYAMEAMIGKAMGSKNTDDLKGTLVVITFWSFCVSFVFTCVFAFWGKGIIGVISSIPAVQMQAEAFLPWLVAMPLVSMWCFLLDGVFVGATRGEAMRNSMVISMITFFAVWFTSKAWGDQALWFAMLSFMAMRGLTLGWRFYRDWQNNTFIMIR
jgi:MATE family multidrug resistance protein